MGRSINVALRISANSGWRSTNIYGWNATNQTTYSICEIQERLTYVEFHCACAMCCQHKLLPGSSPHIATVNGK